MWHGAIWYKFNVILEISAAFFVIVVYSAMPVNLCQLECRNLVVCSAVSFGLVLPNVSKCDGGVMFLQHVKHYSSINARVRWSSG
jgi:hypothetical protein